ncbi:MAG TPA: glycogen debranching N-terminal domain-containing protein [Thermoanaerobaculia bacterium]|nr:glycogen debranching N-terminal domain-containing protein [Thermoanaerobaculia bacterium]
MSILEVRPEILYAWCGPSLLITDPRGECGGEGFMGLAGIAGYYFREARHLSVLAPRIDGQRPWLCEVGCPAPDRIELVLVYPERTEFGGGGSGQSGDAVERDDHGIPYRALDLRLSYRVGLASLEVCLTVANRAREEVRCEVSWELSADFADIQEAHAGRREQEAPVGVETGEGSRLFRYGHPRLPLATRVTGALTVPLRLAPQQEERLELRVEPIDPEEPLRPQECRRRTERLRRWREGFTGVALPGNTAAERTVRNNVRDLASLPLLEGQADEWLAFQAGMPLYPALFGRDTLTAGWQAAFLDHGESLDASLTRLGRLQSDRVYDWRDEEPGRIPQQVRRGPLARLDLNPFAASYADFASPLMFVVSLAHIYAWTGEKALLDRHWDTARRILDWARDHGDRDGDGYLEYQTRSPQGAQNQGWKDSGDAIVYEDGRTAPPPLGTCELQGYWFAAQQLMGFLAWFRGERGDALAWWQEASDLKERFNRDWWMEDEGFPAMALDADKRPVKSVGSNAGHCLACGIVDDEHVPRVVGRLFAPDLWSGWGIRTLSSAHPSYSPLSYHLGSVWAVENATIALGLRRYGFDVRAADIAEGMFALAQLYPDDRIPECVGGFGRWESPSPGAYPRANTPQTWNTSAFPLLLHTLLGLQPMAPLGLLVVDPALPPWLPEVVLRGLRLGGATATLRCWRDQEGRSHAEILEKKGTLRLLRQPAPESLKAGVFDRVKALAETVLRG